MPILIVMAGAYAAYRTNLELNKHKLLKDGGDASSAGSAPCPTEYHLDFTINLTNKSYLKLLPVEIELCVFELPITTLSFFEGSCITAAIHVQARMRAILAKNPWLGGWLIRDEADNYELKLLYDETGHDICQGYFQVYEAYVIPIGRNFTSYHDLGKKMNVMGATIPTMNAKLIGQNNQPIWKIAIIPDMDAPTERFSMAFSMSHVVADAHTYYKIFAMLDQDARIEALQPIRNQSFPQELAKHAGKDEADFIYLRKVLERQPPPPEPKQWLNMTPQESQQLQSKNNRRKRNPLASSHRNTDKVVFKMFFVDEDWLLQQKAGAGGAGGAGGGGGGGGGSGRRGRRSSVYDVTSSSTAAAAEAAATEAASAAVPSVSANSIITSWFFNVTKPSLGLMAANMRNRIDGIGENDMGNYVHTILYTPIDYQTPVLIQESLNHMRRCGSNPISTLPDLWETNKQQQRQQPEKVVVDDDDKKPLLAATTPGANNDDCTTNDTGGEAESTATPTTPPVPATLTSGISINWARHCPEREIYLVPDGSSDDDGGPMDCLGNYCGGGCTDLFPDAAANRNVYAVNSLLASSSTAEEVAAAAAAVEAAVVEEAAAAETTTTTTNDNNNGNGITQTLHIPIFTFQELEVFPDTLSAIAIFTASPRGQHSPERRPGAWLICKESTWMSEIKNCGIVEEMIAEMTL